ncbi:MAG: mechanosensitive ion channel family protein [Bacteroidetes bacterium]|nr:mechanosensitive ion channel family protein [Bacteroidota bacterium]
MKYPRTGSFLIPSILLVLLLILSKSGLFEFPTGAEAQGVLMDKLFYYLINTTLWLTVGHLINLSICVFIWGGLVRFGSSSLIGQKIQDFTSILVYTIVIAIILFGVINLAPSSIFYFLLLIFLVLGTLLRPKILSLISTKYLSSEHPFNIGDWIELINRSGAQVVTGEVYDIGRRGTRIKTESNCIVLIPNNLLEDEFIIKNYWGISKETEFEIIICLDFSIPIERAKRILFAGAIQACNENSISKGANPKILVHNTSNAGIEYSVKFLLNPWQENTPSEAKDKILSTIINHLSKAGVYTAFPKNEIFYTKMSDKNLSMNSTLNRIKILSSIEFFNSFSEAELKKLSENISPATVKENCNIIVQGDEGNSMFILIEGFLEVYITSESGDKIIVGKIAPGGFFGEMSLLTGEKRCATVKAITESRVFEITKNDLAPVLQTRSEIVKEISMVINNRQKINIEKIEESGHKKIHKLDVLINKIKVFFSLTK